MRRTLSMGISFTLVAACLASCGLTAPSSGSSAVAFGGTVRTVEGFSGPEAVRYDPAQDLYFVSNFNGDVSGDANGFVSKVSAEGVILEREFMVGTSRYPFHGGRGSVVRDNSLFVLDAEGMHEFDTRTGRQLGFTDLSMFDPGFPNDVVVTEDGTFFITDTGKSVLYRVSNGVATIASETPFQANGITINPTNGNLVLVPWSGSDEFVEWDPDTGGYTVLGVAMGGGNFDGVEFVRGAIVVASQVDQSLHVMIDGVDGKALDLPGRPADIGVDTRRSRIAVPYVALDAVDIIDVQ